MKALALGQSNVIIYSNRTEQVKASDQPKLEIDELILRIKGGVSLTIWYVRKYACSVYKD